jgi:translation initiation factor RLI1
MIFYDFPLKFKRCITFFNKFLSKKNISGKWDKKQNQPETNKYQPNTKKHQKTQKKIIFIMNGITKQFNGITKRI